MIDKILLNDWDPLGVNEFDEARENIKYLSQVFNLKINGGDQEMIAQKLYKIETEKLGLSGNIDKCRKVAQKIIKVNS